MNTTLLAMLIGFCLCFLLIDIINSFNNFRSYYVPLYNFYQVILNNPNEYYFEKRIGDYGYFKFTKSDLTLIFNCNDYTSSVFRGNTCIVPDGCVGQDLHKKISELLITRHGKQMLSDLYVVNNTFYSKNLLSHFPQETQVMLRELDAKNEKLKKEQEDNKYNFNIDDILVKISETGMDSLTEEEKEFLSRKSNPDTSSGEETPLPTSDINTDSNK